MMNLTELNGFVLSGLTLQGDVQKMTRDALNNIVSAGLGLDYGMYNSVTENKQSISLGVFEKDILISLDVDTSFGGRTCGVRLCFLNNGDVLARKLPISNMGITEEFVMVRNQRMIWDKISKIYVA